MSNEHETHGEHWGPWSAEYLARDDAPANPSPLSNEQTEALAKARIDAADAYWRSKAYHNGEALFSLPGGFFWHELIDAVLATPSPAPSDTLEAAFPATIGRLNLGARRSDGERLCSHGHAVPEGHPLYWPQLVGQYDDSDPYCLEHAIDLAVSDNSWCTCNTGGSHD